ncbi:MULTISPECIES: hypothetical protein [unclassified Mesorhizobium]|jgi:hypothetical protein|uniref:hypothetical protein n=1 Tax=unclassified Mesorhizobium TaxID=325217 RepID=UPI00112D9AEB|nr:MULTISPECIES: hypothetical protein [unclassified Mesorhizobium]TPN44108.1 hypothetical protein FJ976_26960 [Mesorhizobium sp. B1-1-9]TPN54824.1 hypothetical protein FJ978_04835 [Mesorhizobium sp. B1-1-7]
MAAGELQSDDKLSRLLASGWSVVGYSTTMMAAGRMTHSVLLQKEHVLISATIVAEGDHEIGRAFTMLAPAPDTKKRRS